MDEKHNRQVAKMAARNVFKYAAQYSPRTTLEQQLLAEAYATDVWKCSEEEMLQLLVAEYNKIKGQTKGGIISGLRKKHFKGE